MKTNVYLSLGTIGNQSNITVHDGKVLETIGTYIDFFGRKLVFVRLDKKYKIKLMGQEIETDTALLA